VDELVNLVTQRTGIPPAAAQTAVQTVLGFLKDRLPPQVASQLDGIVGGQGAGGIAGQAQQQMGNLGGMFGGGAQTNQGS
jgi:hypothetical protein